MICTGCMVLASWSMSFPWKSMPDRSSCRLHLLGRPRSISAVPPVAWLASCVTRSIHDHTYKISTSSQLFVGHSACSRHPIYLLAFPMTGTHMPISISSEDGPPMFMHIIYISIEMWQQKAKAAYSFIRSQCFFFLSLPFLRELLVLDLSLFRMQQ